MTKFTIIIVLLFLVSPVQAQSGKILFQIKGIQKEKGGIISAGIFLKDGFPVVGKQFMSKEQKVKGESMEILFENVPAGTYAAVVFQDLNSNQKLDTNLIGLPKEPIGFANDARIKFGPPSFEESTVKVLSEKTLTLIIQLR